MRGAAFLAGLFLLMGVTADDKKCPFLTIKQMNDTSDRAGIIADHLRKYRDYYKGEKLNKAKWLSQSLDTALHEVLQEEYNCTIDPPSLWNEGETEQDYRARLESSNAKLETQLLAAYAPQGRTNLKEYLRKNCPLKIDKGVRAGISTHRKMYAEAVKHCPTATHVELAEIYISFFPDKVQDRLRSNYNARAGEDKTWMAIADETAEDSRIMDQAEHIRSEYFDHKSSMSEAEMRAALAKIDKSTPTPPSRAPAKAKNPKQGKADLVCDFCHTKGHIQPNCNKKTAAINNGTYQKGYDINGQVIVPHGQQPAPAKQQAPSRAPQATGKSGGRGRALASMSADEMSQIEAAKIVLRDYQQASQGNSTPSSSSHPVASSSGMVSIPVDQLASMASMIALSRKE